MSEDQDDIFGDDEEDADADAGGAGDKEEGMSLDDDLESMLGDEGGDADAGGDEGESVSLDSDLESMLGELGGDADAGGGEGEGMSLDGDLEAMLEDEGGGLDDPGGSESAAVPSSGGARAGDGVKSSLANLSSNEAINLDFLLDVELDATFEVGRAQMLISDLLTLGQGSVVELHRLVGEELDVFVNGRLIAKGEVVVVNEKFGCRVTEIIAPEERIKHLAKF